MSSTSTASVHLHGFEFLFMAACAMARQGVQAPRRDDCTEGDGFLCPFEGCQYRGKSMRGLNVHLGMIEHHGKLRRDEASGSSETCSSASSQSSSSEVSGASSASSTGSSHSGHDYMYDDEDLDAANSQHAAEEAQSQPQSSLADDEGHSQSDADSDAQGMDIPLGGVAADDVPEPSHSDSAHSSRAAHSDHAHEGPAPDAGLAAPANARRLTEDDIRLHDILNGLPLQRQQHIIDFLQDPALDLSAISATSARRLRKDVRARCKQVRVTTAHPGQCCFGSTAAAMPTPDYHSFAMVLHRHMHTDCMVAPASVHPCNYSPGPAP